MADVKPRQDVVDHFLLHLQVSLISFGHGGQHSPGNNRVQGNIQRVVGQEQKLIRF